MLVKSVFLSDFHLFLLSRYHQWAETGFLCKSPVWPKLGPHLKVSLAHIWPELGHMSTRHGSSSSLLYPMSKLANETWVTSVSDNTDQHPHVAQFINFGKCLAHVAPTSDWATSTKVHPDQDQIWPPSRFFSQTKLITHFIRLLCLWSTVTSWSSWSSLCRSTLGRCGSVLWGCSRRHQPSCWCCFAMRFLWSSGSRPNTPPNQKAVKLPRMTCWRLPSLPQTPTRLCRSCLTV